MAFPLFGMISLSTVSLHFRWMSNQATALTPGNHLQKCRPLNYLYTMHMFLGGLGSFICHSAITYFSAQLDRAGIWCLVAPVIGQTILRFVPLRCGGPKFYAVFAGVFYISFPLGLSLFHLLDPTHPLATPLLYNGLLYTGGAIVFLTLLRHLLSYVTTVFPPLRNTYRNAFFAVALTGVAFMCQKPSRVASCDAKSHLVYKYTHW